MSTDGKSHAQPAGSRVHGQLRQAAHTRSPSKKRQKKEEGEGAEGALPGIESMDSIGRSLNEASQDSFVSAASSQDVSNSHEYHEHRSGTSLLHKAPGGHHREAVTASSSAALGGSAEYSNPAAFLDVRFGDYSQSQHSHSQDFIDRMGSMWSKMSQASEYDSIMDDETRSGFPTASGSSASGGVGTAPAMFQAKICFSQTSDLSNDTVIASNASESRDGFELGISDRNVSVGIMSIDGAGRLLQATQCGSLRSIATDDTATHRRGEDGATAAAGAGGKHAQKGLSFGDNPFLPKRHAPPRMRPFSPNEDTIYTSNYEHEISLGRGAFSDVYVSRRKLDGTLYAVKRLNAKFSGERMQQRVLKEVHALAVLRGCPNLITYYDSWVEEGHLWIATELCLKETLYSFILYGPLLTSSVRLGSNTSSMVTPRIPSAFTFEEDEYATNMTAPDAAKLHRNLSTTSTGQPVGAAGRQHPAIGGFQISEELAWVIIETIGSALAYIHDKGMAHLDVKPSNILIAPSSYFELEEIFDRLKFVNQYSKDHWQHLTEIEPNLVSGKWKLRLGDLGHCCRPDTWTGYQEEGDTRYCAAELIMDDHPDLAATDVFSLGASVYELCTGTPLQEGGYGGASSWRDIRSGKLDLLDAAPHCFSPVESAEDQEIVAATQEKTFSQALVSCIRKMMAPIKTSQRPLARDLRRTADWGT